MFAAGGDADEAGDAEVVVLAVGVATTATSAGRNANNRITTMSAPKKRVAAKRDTDRG
jgi:hypothetical protein